MSKHQYQGDRSRGIGTAMMTETDYIVLYFLLGALAVWLLLRYAKRLKGKRVQKRGKRGEEAAVALLRSQGYRVLDRQVTKPATIYVDGKCHESHVHADMVVQKGWRRYIVEVKTGKQANPALANVRRQLLEYNFVFEPDGMLFVDIEKKRIREVAFDRPMPGVFSVRFRYFFFGVCLGGIVVSLLFIYFV